MNLNERISKVIEYANQTPSEFADAIEVQRSSISHITSGRNKPSLDFVIKIKEQFPELQWDWLIKGEGEMTTPKEKEVPEDKKPPTSLPDLFSLIDDDNFGITESEDTIKSEPAREAEISAPTEERNNTADSQRLVTDTKNPAIQSVDNKQDKVKRIVFFYENGKFESFES